MLERARTFAFDSVDSVTEEGDFNKIIEIKDREQHLCDFQDNEKSNPTILTMSQKLRALWSEPETRQKRLQALADLGQAEEIGQIFAGFQKYLYCDSVVA